MSNCSEPRNIFKSGLRFCAKALIAMIIGSAVIMSGCSHKKKDEFTDLKDPPDVIYNQALANVDKGKFKEASKKFAALDRQYPYSDWARKALVMGSYSYYKQKKYTDAINMAKRYIALYPTSKESAYAYYMIGLSYFRQIPDVTHDQGDASRAADALQEVVNRFPNSEYVSDAKAKIRFAREQMAGKEMMVGRYYEEQHQYLAAIKRFRYVVEHYSDTNQVEEALYRLVETNYTMGLAGEAQAAAHALGQNYPDSPWYKMAYKLLQKNGLSPKEQEGGWLSKVFSKVIPHKETPVTKGQDVEPDASLRGNAASPLPAPSAAAKASGGKGAPNVPSVGSDIASPPGVAVKPAPEGNGFLGYKKLKRML